MQELESEHNIKLCKQLEAQLKQMQEGLIRKAGTGRAACTGRIV